MSEATPQLSIPPEAAWGPTFDVGRATDAYIATIPAADRARSDAYFEGGYWIGLWGTLLTRLPTSTVAPLTLLVPVVGLSSAWLLLGEQLSALQIAGAATILTGLAIHVFGRRLLAAWTPPAPAVQGHD